MKTYFWRALPLALALTACSKVYTPTPYNAATPHNNLIKPVQTSALNALTAAQVYEELKSTLKKLNSAMKDRYGLAEYKKSKYQLDLDSEMNKILEGAQKLPHLSIDTAQQLIARYLESTRDEHTKALFMNRPYLLLDITVAAVDGKVLVTSVDKNCRCAIQVGDEVLAYDGAEIADALKNLMSTEYSTLPGKDLRDATRRMTERYGFFGEPVPQPGSLANLVLRSDAHGNKYGSQLPWKVGNAKTNSLVKSRYGVEMNRGHVLRLSNLLWQSDKDSQFTAWIGQDGKGVRVGYLRISAFSLEDKTKYSKAIADLDEIISKMNSDSDTMMVDVTEASGGETAYVYGIVSRFLNDKAPMPSYQYRVSKDLVKSTKAEIETLSKVGSDPSAAKLALGGSSYYGLPSQVELVKAMVESKQLIVDASKAGNAYSAFIPNLIPGLAPLSVHYANPILVLVDSGTASGGELFASILQDLGRAKIMGEQTAGVGSLSGGGFLKVKDLGVDNNLGLAALQIPVALTKRINGDYLENEGVSPDNGYGLSIDAKDFTASKKFKTYSAAVVKAAKALVTVSSKP